MKQKTKTNYGEKFVETMAKCIESGRYDDFIDRMPPVRINDTTTIYEFVFKKNKHIANWLSVSAEVSFEYDKYSVKHHLIEDYIIDGDVAKSLFFAMSEASDRIRARIKKEREEKIVQFLKSQGEDTE